MDAGAVVGNGNVRKWDLRSHAQRRGCVCWLRSPLPHKAMAVDVWDSSGRSRSLERHLWGCSMPNGAQSRREFNLWQSSASWNLEPSQLEARDGCVASSGEAIGDDVRGLL